MPYLCHHTFRSAPRHSWKSMCVIGTGTVAHTHAQSGRTRTGHEAESQAGLAEWGLPAPIQAIHYTRSVVRVQLCNGARRPLGLLVSRCRDRVSRCRDRVSRRLRATRRQTIRESRTWESVPAQSSYVERTKNFRTVSSTSHRTEQPLGSTSASPALSSTPWPSFKSVIRTCFALSSCGACAEREQPHVGCHTLPLMM